jgi:hypothetical protein
LFLGRQQTILEIGGGSGYIGALLVQMGYGYISTDITQAFYIAQNHVLNAVAGDRFIELATDPRSFFDFPLPPTGICLHVPWWKFVVADPQPKFSVDLVTCNHALLEMDAIALKYNCRIAHALLSGGGLRCFLFEGWGNPIRTQIWQATRTITKAGLCFAYNDSLFPILVRTDAKEAFGVPALPVGTTDDEAAWHPSIYIDPESTLAKQIKSGRDAAAQKGKYSIRDFDALLKEILGTDDLMIDDERFLSYCAEEAWPPKPRSASDQSVRHSQRAQSRTRYSVTVWNWWGAPLNRMLPADSQRRRSPRSKPEPDPQPPRIERPGDDAEQKWQSRKRYGIRVR